MTSNQFSNRFPRRSALRLIAGLGVTSPTLGRALAMEAERGPLTVESIAAAEWVSGVRLQDSQREALLRNVGRLQQQLEELRRFPLDPDAAPALQFVPNIDGTPPLISPVLTKGSDQALASATVVSPDSLPTSEIDIAYASLSTLAAMLRQREISSLQLTELFLERLERLGPQLNCVVHLTADLARQQAKQADRDFAAGRIRSPLQGIPWGAKDLIAVTGYPTTWGADAFKEQSFSKNATVYQRLSDSGAVLVAKLTLGAYAMGDQWFGGRTNNPWNLQQGSSGSSAGSAAATAAGLVPFAIGSETLGSIVSPSTRCGVTGLRPTFGRVSRAGCMPLAWSFDKLGPMARSVEDCAIVFEAIHGSDGRDVATVSYPFAWPYQQPIAELRIGYTGSPMDRPELDLLRELGATLVPITLPADFPTSALTMMIDVESASMFYEQWSGGEESGLYRWARIWQTAAFVPAIDYLRAARVRSTLMQAMQNAIREVDLYVGGDDLVLTNLTGHPTVVIPYRPPGADKAAQPSALTFSGHLYQEDKLLAVAKAFQKHKGDHLSRPPLFS